MNILEQSVFTHTGSLTAELVDEVAVSLEEFLLESKALDSALILKLRLAVDAILVHYLEHLPEGVPVELQIYKKFGHKYVRLTVKGAMTNPLAEEETEGYLAFTHDMLSRVDIAPQYHYTSGKNIVTIALPTQPLNPALLTLGGVAASVLTYGLCTALLTPPLIASILKNVIHPLFQSVMGLLNLAAMLMIFFSLLSSFCSMPGSDSLEKYGTLTLRRVLGVNVLTTVIGSLLVALTLGRVNVAGGSFSLASLQDIYLLLLGIIPKNVVAPFLNGDALQITFLAVTSGILLVSMREKCQGLINDLCELSLFTTTAVSKICSLLPLIVYLSFTELLLAESKVDMSSILLLPVAQLILALLYVVVILTEYQYKTGYRASYYLREIVPIAVTAFTTASSLACYSMVEKFCQKYNVEERLLHFALPLLQVFQKTSYIITFSAGIFVLLYIYGIELSIAQFILFILTLLLMVMAAPAVPGGALAMYALLVRHVGLPAEALSLILAIDIILDMLSTTATVVSLPAGVIVLDKRMKKG